MSQVTTRQRSTPPWLLPVLLALVIALIVLAFIFGPRIKDALSSKTPTPTPKTVLVTATPNPAASGPTATPVPGAPTATPGSGAGTSVAPPAVPPTATPGGKGISTPITGGTPIPAVPGLQLGLIARPQKDVAAIQQQVDAHNPSYQYYLNPIKVVQNNLPAYGFTNGFQIVAPNPTGPTPTPFVGASRRPVVKVNLTYQNNPYTVFVTQTGKQGPTGIWQIVTIVPGKQ